MNTADFDRLEKPSEEMRGELPRLIERMEEAIVFGRFVPRERLVEADLMARFAARRHMVRTAISTLERRGIVTRQANRGASVRELSAAEIEDLYEMRVLLHRAAADRMALPVSPDWIAHLRTVQARHGAAVQKGDLRQAFHENDLFHRAVNDLAGNGNLSEALATYTERSNLVRSAAFRNPERLAASAAEHEAMIDALEAGDRTRFRELSIAHVLTAKTAYLQGVQSGYLPWQAVAPD